MKSFKFFQPPGFQEVKTDIAFKVTLIGGKAELEAWKAEQKAKHEVLDAKRAKCVDNVKATLQAGNVDVEAAKVLQAALDAEAAEYKAMTKSYKNATEAPQRPEYEEFDAWATANPPKQTDLKELKEKIKAMASNLWKQAFPE